MTTELFFSYSHKDEKFLKELESPLDVLKRDRLATSWYDRYIEEEQEWEKKILHHLNKANIILLLISPDFMDSDYCYSVEMMRTMERHHEGDATVIPIILRPTIWNKAPFAKLQALPSNGKPITNWISRDQGYQDIVNAIRNKIEKPIHHAKLKQLREENIYRDFLEDVSAVDLDTLEQPNALKTWEAADKALDSLYMWAGVALAVRCSERASAILSHWPLRKHCAVNAIRAARECAIKEGDFHMFGYERTMDRIEELTGIGRGAFDAGVEAQKSEGVGSAPHEAAASVGLAVFAARDAFRGATTSCALFAVQQSAAAYRIIGDLFKDSANSSAHYEHIRKCIELVPIAATQADYEWLNERISDSSSVPEDFFQRNPWCTQNVRLQEKSESKPWWKFWKIE